MYCLLCGILPDRIKYIWTPKAETQSTVKPASTPTKTAVPSTILCSLCYHAELSAITAGRAGGVHPLNSGPFPSKTPETWSISAVIFKSLNKTAVVLTVFFLDPLLDYLSNIQHFLKISEHFRRWHSYESPPIADERQQWDSGQRDCGIFHLSIERVFMKRLWMV